MRKPFSLTLLLITLLLGTLTASAQEPVQLTLAGWGGADEEALMHRLIDEFNAANPDVEITFEVWHEFDNQIVSSVDNGTPPDITFVPDYLFPSLMERGALVNLQSHADSSAALQASPLMPSAQDRFRFDDATDTFGAGDVYALPKDVGPMVLYINEDLFDAAEVPLPDPTQPMTWDTFVDIAQRLTLDADGNHAGEDDFDPRRIAQYGIADFRWELAVYNNGGRIVSDDGRVFVAGDDPNTIEALQWLSDLRHEYHVAPGRASSDAEQAYNLWERGLAAMHTEARWRVPSYRTALPFNWSARPLPVGPSGELTTAGNQAECRFSGWSSATGLGVLAGSEGEQHLDEAFRFIEFLASSDAQSQFAELGFAVPNQLAVAGTPAFLQPDQPPANAAAFVEAARCQVAAPWTHTPDYGEWFDPLFWDAVYVDVIEDNTASADQAFDARTNSFQQALDEAWQAFDGA